MPNQYWTREERERFATCTGEQGQHSRDAELCPLHEMAEVGTEEVARILATVQALRGWIESVPTDAQLDAPVQSLGGITGRDLLAALEGKS